MSYDPTNWSNGDVITSAKLNKIEQGVANAGGGGGALLVNADGDGKLDKTAGEIYNAFQNGHVVIKTINGDSVDLMILGYANFESEYGYMFIAYYGMENPLSFEAATAEDYPTIVREG